MKSFHLGADRETLQVGATEILPEEPVWQAGSSGGFRPSLYGAGASGRYEKAHSLGGLKGGGVWHWIGGTFIAPISFEGEGGLSLKSLTDQCGQRYKSTQKSFADINEPPILSHIQP